MTTPPVPIIPGPSQQPTPPLGTPPPPAQRQSWWHRLPPLVRALGIVAVISAPIVVGVWVFSLILAATGYGVPTQPGNGGGDVSVQLSGCQETRGFYKATLTVTNSTSRSRTVFVDIEWLDRGGVRLANTTEVVSSVDPGQTAKEEAVGVGPEYGSSVKCSYRVR